MSTEENKAVVRRYYDEVINGKRHDLVDELLAPDFKGFRDTSRRIVGRERIKQVATFLRTFSPDYVETIEDLIAEGDRVVVRCTIQGTAQGVMDGIPGAGKPYHLQAVDIWLVRDGKFVANWITADVLSMFEQLGATLTPAPVPAPVAA